MKIKNVVVVGAGMMGNALAQVFASDPDLNVILKTRALKEDRWEPIINNLDIMISRGAATEEENSAFSATSSSSPTMRRPILMPILSSSAIRKSWK